MPQVVARVFKKHWLRMLPLWLSPIPMVVYTFVDPQMAFNNLRATVICGGLFIPLALVGTLLMIKVMEQPDYPFVTKSFLLVGIPFLGVAALTVGLCELIFTR